MNEVSKLIPALCQSIEEAGKIILNFYNNKNYTVLNKKDNTPQTQADWEAHLYLEKKLKELSTYPLISEESFEHGMPLPSGKYFWLMDPLDGTKHFLNRSGQFTINLALIEDEFPILGIIYVPVSGELFHAYKDRGAFKKVHGGTFKKIQVTALDKKAPRFLLSRKKQDLIDKIHSKWPESEITWMGSSLKYCRIAEGSADIYIRQYPTHEWDTAAAQCVLEEAGGFLYDLKERTRLHYRKKDLINNSLAAFSDGNVSINQFLY